MKTNHLFSLKNFNYLILILVGISIASCGSFKNSSYEENDGIYSSSSKRESTLNKEEQYVQVKPNNEYAQKFKELQRNFEESNYFTDVNSYVSENDTVATVARSYPDWGSNSTEININYHNFGWNNWGWNGWYNPMWNNWGWNNWGWNNCYGYGWNNWGFNPWFAGYYGIGWNNWYGYGWNNWGWNNWYGYNVAYNNGRRGMNGNFGNGSGRYVTVEGRSSQIGNSNTRTNTRIAPTTRNSDTRISNPDTRTTPTRVTTSPTRTTSPSTLPSRSSSPSRVETGGGRSSGSFGGGSSSGGGRSGGSSGGGRGGRG